MACTTRTWGFSACEKTEKRWHRNSCCHKFVKVFECIEGSLSVWLWPPFDRDKGNQRQILLLKKFQIIKGVLFDPFSLGQKAQLITVFGSKRGTKECRKESCYSWEKIEKFGRTGIHTSPFRQAFRQVKIAHCVAGRCSEVQSYCMTYTAWSR